MELFAKLRNFASFFREIPSINVLIKNETANPLIAMFSEIFYEISSKELSNILNKIFCEHFGAGRGGQREHIQ